MKKRHWISALVLLSLPAAVCADQGRDVILGNGTAGPYPLSWKQVIAGTDTVSVNTLSQTRGLDYTFDPAAGTITFTSPLPAQAGAEVDYQYDPSHAVRTGAGLTVPVSLSLTNGLSLDATYKQAAGAANTNSGNLSIGLGGAWQGARGQLTTHLLFAPQLQSTATTQDPDSLSRIGLAFSGSSQASPVAKFSFGYSRIGTDLGTITVPAGTQVGVQALALGTDLTPSHQVAAFVHYTQSDPLTAGQAMTSQVATGLTYTPLSKLQLQTHWTEATASGVTTYSLDMSVTAKPTTMSEIDASVSGKDSPAAGNDAEALSLAAKLAPAKTLSLQAQVGQSATGQSGTTQTASVTVNAQPTPAAQVNASVSVNDAPGTSADTQAVNLAAKILPSHTVTVNASAGQTRLGDTATDHQQLVVAMTPRAQIQLHTGVTLSQTDQFATAATNFGGAFQPASYLQFSADYTCRTAPSVDPTAQDGLDSSAAQVTLTPVKGLHVTGHYTQNQNTTGVFQHVAQHGVGLDTTVGAVHLTGGYDWSRQYDTDAVGTALNFGLGVRLSSALQITGGYQQTLTGLDTTPAGTCLYSFGLVHNLGDRFSLSMTGTMQQQTGQTVAANPNYTASANLGMKF
jgi:hypothetical protein